jgi:hypothetical protein
MAEMIMQHTRLLGFAPLAAADALYATMQAIPGPEVHMQAGPATVALFQHETATPLAGLSRDALIAGLQSVQRRLEAGCAAGPFLPMDPAAACCSTGVLPQLLQPAWEVLAQALAAHGARQQWDIVLHWAPETVVARHRAEIAPLAAHGPQALAEAVGAVLRAQCARHEAALLAALTPAVLAFAEGGAACTDTQVLVTVLVATNAEAAVEAALDALPADQMEGVSIDMRGPLPPLSFSAVRLATVQPDAVTQAWATLGLPDHIDLSTLHRHWRLAAAAAHPDRQPAVPAGGVTVSDLTAAYHLLRDLLPPNETHSLGSLLRNAGPRLVIPASAATSTPAPDRAPMSVQLMAALA